MDWVTGLSVRLLVTATSYWDYHTDPFLPITEGRKHGFKFGGDVSCPLLPHPNMILRPGINAKSKDTTQHPQALNWFTFKGVV